MQELLQRLILYTVTRKPLILTVVWTGIASLITAIPFIYFGLIGWPNLLYAPGLGDFLVISLVGSVF